MGFHPDDESNEFLDDSLDMDDEDIPSYAMIFYQGLSLLSLLDLILILLIVHHLK